MTLDFPSGPYNGQEYTYDGIVYIWDGEKWTKAATDGIPGAKGAKGEPGGGGSGSGTVESVNDILPDGDGDVSIGIQDMNDYALNPPELYDWTYSNTVGSNPGDGQVGFITAPAFSKILYFNAQDADGNDRLTFLEGLPGEEVTLVYGSTIKFTATVTAIDVIGGTRIQVDFAEDVTPIPSAGSTISLTTDDPAGPQLAEGDILRWDDTDQKFKPSQISSDGDGAKGGPGEKGAPGEKGPAGEKGPPGSGGGGTAGVSSITAGSGISVNQATGDVTVTSTVDPGVTRLEAGSNISLSGNTGSVTISASGGGGGGGDQDLSSVCSNGNVSNSNILVGDSGTNLTIKSNGMELTGSSRPLSIQNNTGSHLSLEGNTYIGGRLYFPSIVQGGGLSSGDKVLTVTGSDSGIQWQSMGNYADSGHGHSGYADSGHGHGDQYASRDGSSGAFQIRGTCNVTNGGNVNCAQTWNTGNGGPNPKYVYVSGDGVYRSNNTFRSSSMTNVQDADTSNFLTLLKAIHLKRFQYKSDHEDTVGYEASEISKTHFGIQTDIVNATAAGEFVTRDEYSLNNDRAIAFLVGVCQEQEKVIENLQTRLAAIESNEVVDDAVDSALLGQVMQLSSRVTALES